jgi:class 3 adenylate cyclase
LTDDVAGMAVHIGARVAALADANEALVSSTVKDLVSGDPACVSRIEARVF